MRWYDRIVEFPKRFRLINNSDGTVTLEPQPGNIIQAGTQINATNMNSIEERIEGNYEHDVQLSYTNGNLTKVETFIGGVIRRRETLAYTGDTLTSVTTQLFKEDGETLEDEFTDTLNYTDGGLTSIERTVA
jgi:hypothetical protein